MLIADALWAPGSPLLSSAFALFETEPVFLAAAVDCILGNLGDGEGRGEWGGGYKERGSAVRIHPAWTATLGLPARQPGASACRAAVALTLRPQSLSRARWTVAGFSCPHAHREGSGTPGGAGGGGSRQLWSCLLPGRGPPSPCYLPGGTAPSLPLTVGEPRARRSAKVEAIMVPTSCWC